MLEMSHKIGALESRAQGLEHRIDGLERSIDSRLKSLEKQTGEVDEKMDQVLHLLSQAKGGKMVFRWVLGVALSLVLFGGWVFDRLSAFSDFLVGFGK